MRSSFLVLSVVLAAYVVGDAACGGTALQIPGDSGSAAEGGVCGPCGHRGPDVEQPEGSLGQEDVVVFQDAPSDETGVEDGSPDAPDSAIIDAGGLLPPACSECLNKECTTAYDQCFEDPQCVQAIRCLDACVADGGTADPCALHCLELAPADGEMQGAALLECATKICSGPCEVSPTEAGVD
jgi:hypothetical protein